MRNNWGGVKRAAVGGLLATAVSIGAAGIAAQQATTERLPTVDQVLDRYVAALGGKAAMQKIKSRILTGSMEIPENGLQGTVTFYAKAPNKRKYTINLPGLGEFIQCFDGTAGWASNPNVGLRDLSGPELAQERVSADFYGALNMRTAFSDLRVRGKEKVGELDAYVVEGKEATGGPRIMYFDAASGYLIRVTVERESAEGKVTFENYIDDYREVEGVMVPHLLTQQQPQFSLVTRITEVKTNAPVDDAVFAKPVK